MNLIGLILADGQNTANEIAQKIIDGLSKVGPWLCTILAVCVLGMLIYHLIKYFMAKSQGNEQDAEKNKKGIIWGVALLIVCASFGIVFGFLKDIAAAFGVSFNNPQP